MSIRLAASCLLATIALSAASAHAFLPPGGQEGCRSPALSPDGRWFACVLTSEASPNRLLVREVEGEALREVPGGDDPSFDLRSRSLLYTAPYATPDPGGLEHVVRNLDTWEVRCEFRGKAQFVRGADSDFLVGMASPGSDEVSVYSLADGRTLVAGRATRLAVSGDGRLVALVADQPGGRSSLRLLRLGESAARPVCELPGEITSLSWGDDDRSVALIVVQDRADGGTEDVLVSIADTAADTPRLRSIVPEREATWPLGAYVEPLPHRVGDGTDIVYVSARAGFPPPPPRPAGGDPEVHRAADPIAYDSRRDVLLEGFIPPARWRLAWLPAAGRLVRVADEAVAAAVVPRGGRRAVVPRSVDRRRPAVEPADWDVLDPTTGNRTPLGPGQAFGIAPSPSGRYVAFFARGVWWAFDGVDSRSRELAAGVASSFEADLAEQFYSYGPIAPAEWLPEDRGLVAHDRHDAWLLRPGGGEPKRLTRGREAGRTYRLAHIDGANLAKAGETLIFHVVDEATLNSGYAGVEADGTETVIIPPGPWAYADLIRAGRGGRFVARRESHDAPPNYVATTGRGGQPAAMTCIVAAPIAGSPPRRELITYRDCLGRPLHGTLVYPVEHDPLAKYPMIVSIYLRQSKRHFRFQPPQPSLFDDPATHAGRGYFVLLPDIVHRPDEVGPSALDCVEAAVREVIRLGLVDPARVGLMGQSHGGYETAYIFCKSRLFAAGVAASPVTDPMTQLLTGRLGNVDSEDRVYRYNEGFRAPFWDASEAAIRNSVLYQAHGITTPLLIGIGKRDPVVDCRQGEALFSLLRHQNKPAWLVAYPQGGHGMDEDFARRCEEFLDHHLKGGQPADWISGAPRR